jgi:hypothetical protein
MAARMIGSEPILAFTIQPICDGSAFGLVARQAGFELKDRGALGYRPTTIDRDLIDQLLELAWLPLLADTVPFSLSVLRDHALGDLVQLISDSLDLRIAERILSFQQSAALREGQPWPVRACVFDKAVKTLLRRAHLSASPTTQARLHAGIAGFAP